MNNDWRDYCSIVGMDNRRPGRKGGHTNMVSNTSNVNEFLADLQEDRRSIMRELHAAISKNLPAGFEEMMCYGLPSWVVPLDLYPAGYNYDSSQPLPFISIASPKSHIAVYHMGIYSSDLLLEWFLAEWPKYSSKKLDMGKSCIRFKRPLDVPVELIGKLAAAMTPAEWIAVYETAKPPKSRPTHQQ